MNITLFGGSFNPPHLGHLMVIQQAFELIPNIDELWLLPDYRHSFAKNTTLIDARHRLKMTQMLDRPKVKTEACAVTNKMSGNTIEHITFLKRQYPERNFSFLMGSDNLKSFRKWPQWETLLDLMPFYIYPRANVTLQPLEKNMVLLQHPLQVITNLSSTMIRTRLENGLPVDNLLPAPVLQYIDKHSLYRK